MTKRYDSHVLIIQLKFGLVRAGTAVIAVISGTLFTFPLSLPLLPQWNFHHNLACVAWQFCWAERTSSDAAGRKKEHVAPAPISSRFLCPCPPLLLSTPNQRRLIIINYAPQHCIFHKVSTIICWWCTLQGKLPFAFLSKAQKRRLCLNCVKLLKLLKSKLWDYSILLSIIKLVF